MLLRFNVILVFIFMLKTMPVAAEVIDLGASEIQSKKEAPEAITFISRAPLDESGEVIKFDGKAKIIEEINTSKLFDLVY
ncbi:MAG TPA: hypothetical protein VEK06_01655 [Myxococcota bacterium]|nr:hypothetical protein [Myxococcota bacterium]